MVESVKPLVIVLMGVCGCGKSSVGELLAKRLGWEFVEGDTFHSEANVAKMRAGVALDDEDRWPWLRALAGEIEKRLSEGRGMVLACSALKRGYREVLKGTDERVAFVFLDGTKDLIERRLRDRVGHYMPAGLLDSQFEALERPSVGEGVLTVGIEGDIKEIAGRIMAKLGI